jgi:glutathione synthase/RimK-type ligase-like ATP-grasp enzyme
MRKIGLVTYRREPDLTDDDRPLIEEFASLGARATPVIWDDPGVRLTDFDALVLRSCWDYHLRQDEFEGWLAEVDRSGTKLFNPASVVRWNMHKRYLLELGERGLLVPETELVSRGDRRQLSDILRSRGWEDVIIKPAVSASATDTFRASSTVDAGAELFGKLLRRTDLMVQRFAPEVVAAGEWSLIFIDGQFSHGVIKRPKTDDFRVHQEFGGSADAAMPPARVIADATKVAESLPAGWLFARIDGVEVAQGFMLMEAECIEPLLFFALAPEARRTLAQAIVARC